MTPDDFARIDLGFFPTPIEPLDRIGASLGLPAAHKRTIIPASAAGGNKVRKLEFLMADALAARRHHADHHRRPPIQPRPHGGRGSLPLRHECPSWCWRGDAPSEYQGNLLLDRLFGATLEFLDPTDYFHLIDGRMEAHAQAERDAGGVPYIIPLGGANPLGALGYVRAVAEMRAQLQASGGARPDFIVAPVGSGGTLAGLHVGVRRHWPDTRVIGISVSRDSAWFQQRVALMATEWRRPAGLGHAVRLGRHLGGRRAMSARGMASRARAAWAAIRRVAAAEGVLLDPGLHRQGDGRAVRLVQSGAIPGGADILFLHCGGSPALYPFARAHDGGLTARHAPPAAPLPEPPGRAGRGRAGRGGGPMADVRGALALWRAGDAEMPAEISVPLAAAGPGVCAAGHGWAGRPAWWG